jgi:hypothetical protein
MKTTVDPNGQYKGIAEKKLIQAAGLLPFFAQDVSTSKPDDIQECFDMLMECYGFGMGQDGSGWGTIDPETGVYKSEHEDGPDMDPLIKFEITPELTWYVYQYAITGLTDGYKTMIVRMD